MDEKIKEQISVTIGEKTYKLEYTCDKFIIDKLIESGEDSPLVMLATEEIHRDILSRLTEVAWSSYNKSVGGKSYNGDPLPTYEELVNDPSKKSIVKAWDDSIAAVMDEIGYPTFKTLQ